MIWLPVPHHSISFYTLKMTEVELLYCVPSAYFAGSVRVTNHTVENIECNYNLHCRHHPDAAEAMLR